MQVLQVLKDGLAKTGCEIVVKHFDDASQVLELLWLLAIGRNGDEDGAHTVAKDAVRECRRVVLVLNVEQLFHALLGHLLNVALVALEELEEDANDLCLYLDDVKV